MEALYNWMMVHGYDPAWIAYAAAFIALVLIIAIYLHIRYHRPRGTSEEQISTDQVSEDKSAAIAEEDKPETVEPVATSQVSEPTPEAEVESKPSSAPAVEPVAEDKAEEAPEPEAAKPEEPKPEEPETVAAETEVVAEPESEVEVEAEAEAEAEPAAADSKPEAVEETPAVEAENVPETPVAAEVEPKAEVEQPPESVTETVAESELEEKSAAPAPAPEPVAEEPKKNLFARIKQGLSRTKSGLTEQLGNLFLGAKEIDEDLLEEIETLLLMADVGVEATSHIIETLTDKVERNQLKDPAALHEALKAELADLLEGVEQPLELPTAKKPAVILMVGVNGVGKTTTIGKLAKRYQGEGKSVMLAAGDTFRAAAVEQLQVWGERNHVPVIAQHTGADSASVLYDALEAAKARDVDVLIADTAGRLQNKDNLMQELQKVIRVMQKLDPTAPHEVMLVLDAGTGQNAISQAQTFQEAVGVTGITLTKLDGTAKGGIIFAIAKKFGLPIRFIGVGEQIDDLRPFKAKEFVDALFD